MKRNGFTLIEVIVAITILSVSFVLVMQLFSKGLIAARASCDYSKAIVFAKGKMESIISGIDYTGENDDEFTWESDTEPYEGYDMEGNNVVKINLKVSWGDRPESQKSVKLVTLKVVSDDE